MNPSEQEAILLGIFNLLQISCRCSKLEVDGSKEWTVCLFVGGIEGGLVLLLSLLELALLPGYVSAQVRHAGDRSDTQAEAKE